jgi:hypothetical protein
MTCALLQVRGLRLRCSRPAQQAAALLAPGRRCCWLLLTLPELVWTVCKRRNKPTSQQDCCSSTYKRPSREGHACTRMSAQVTPEYATKPCAGHTCKGVPTAETV